MFHMDQIPVEILGDGDCSTLDTKGSMQVRVKRPRGTGKRFCTIQLTIRAEGSQPAIEIIYSGKGVQLTEVELAYYEKLIALKV